MQRNKEKGKKKKKVCFQTGGEPNVEEETMKTFLVFESGNSGELTFNEFQQAVGSLGMAMDSKQARHVSSSNP
jgi:hypothetical protein